MKTFTTEEIRAMLEEYEELGALNLTPYAQAKLMTAAKQLLSERDALEAKVERLREELKNATQDFHEYIRTHD